MCLQNKLGKTVEGREEVVLTILGAGCSYRYVTRRSVMILDVEVAPDIYVTAVADMYGGDVASTSTWTLEEKDMTL